MEAEGSNSRGLCLQQQGSLNTAGCLGTDRVFDGCASCLAGRFARDNCPAYLIKENFLALKNGLIDNLHICTGTFLDALTSRTFTKARAHLTCCRSTLLWAHTAVTRVY